MTIARDLNARSVGSGPECLVLSHGFGGDQSVWARFVPWLAERYRVVTFDLPCAGTVQPSVFDLTRHGTFDGYADDIHHVLLEMACEGCTFVGHSVSGMLGLLAAVRTPGLVSRLVMLGASARYLDAPDYHGGFDEASLSDMFAAVTADYRAWAFASAPQIVDRPHEDPSTVTFLNSLLRMRPDLALVTMKAIFFSDLRDEVPKCRIPTAILQMRNDVAVPLEAAEYLHEHIAGSVLEVIDASGHQPHITAPEVVADAFRRHLPRFAGTA